MTTKKVLLIAVAALLLAACGKEVLSLTGKNLGEYTVESDAGEFTVLITGEGIWKAESSEQWISVDNSWHRDNYTVVIQYGSNQSVEGMHRGARKGSVLIMSADGAQCDTITVIQKGLQL